MSNIEFPSIDVLVIPDMGAVLKHLDANLEILQAKAMQYDFTDPAHRMHFKDDIAWLRVYYDRAERLTREND
jgi:hypothetical protein